MKTLAFLQNQWFKEPDRVKEIYDRNPGKRNYFIAQFLFMDCLTGRRLEKAFGEEVCQGIIWEECSPVIGGHSGSSFAPDLEHMRKAITQFNPDVIITFGRYASDALLKIAKEGNLLTMVICAPHPAMRGNPVPELERAAAELKRCRETWGQSHKQET